MNFENNITLEQKHNSIPIYIIESKKMPEAISSDPLTMQWILSNQYEAKPGKYLIIPELKEFLRIPSLFSLVMNIL